MTFYRDDYVLVEEKDVGPPGAIMANFVRGRDGRAEWFSSRAGLRSTQLMADRKFAGRVTLVRHRLRGIGTFCLARSEPRALGSLEVRSSAST